MVFVRLSFLQPNVVFVFRATLVGVSLCSHAPHLNTPLTTAFPPAHMIVLWLFCVVQDSLYEYNQKQRVLRLWGKRVTQVTAAAAKCVVWAAQHGVREVEISKDFHRPRKPVDQLQMCVVMGPPFLAPWPFLVFLS